MNLSFLNQLQTAHEQGVFAKFIRAFAKTSELFEILPQLRGLDQIPQDPRWHPEGDVWTHTLLVIENLPQNATFAMALSALFHDIGKASTTVLRETGRITTYGHENVSKKMADEILDNLGADPQLKKEVLFLIRNHMIAHGKDTKAKTLRKLILEGGAELVNNLLLHGVADVAGGCRDFTECERLRHLFDHLITQLECDNISSVQVARSLN